MEFEVTKLEDTADGVCDSDCSLREAIFYANIVAGPDEVVITPKGTFLLTIPDSGSGIQDGDLDITSEMTITGKGPSATVIDASGLGDGVLSINVTDPTYNLVTLQGLTITGGSSESGAGITVDAGNLTLSNVTVSGNQASTSCGGIIVPKESELIIEEGSVISDNEAAEYGGGICHFGGSYPLTITDSTISDNQASQEGGGIYTSGSSSEPAVVTITRSTISGNSAEDGGGIWASSSTLSLTASTIAGNSASSQGAGIYGYRMDASIVSSTLSRNSGMGLALSYLSNVELSNSTVFNNEGWGMAVDSNCSLTLESVTAGMDRNSYPVIFASSPVSLRNSIITGGSCIGTVSSSGGNLESPGDTCGLAGTEQRSVADPMLSQLGDFGGPTQTVMPLPGSPAIDNGALPSAYAWDQRYYVRLDDKPDIGAVERFSVDPEPIFLDGFEWGDTVAWSSTAP